MAELVLSRSESNSFVMDAEIVAINPNTFELLTFQELSNRPRKDVKLIDVKVAVCVYAFDLLYLNGKVRVEGKKVKRFSRMVQSILEEPFRKRRELLRTRFTPYSPDEVGVARFDHVESVESEEGRDAVEEFWQRAIDGRVEGLMVKVG